MPISVAPGLTNRELDSASCQAKEDRAEPIARKIFPWGPQPSTTHGRLGYLKSFSGKPYNYMYTPPEGIAVQNCEYERRTVPIMNARLLAERPSVERQGFELWDAPTKMKNFRDDDEVTRLYFGEVGELAKAVTGGNRVYIFDHQIREREPGRPELTFGRQGDGSKPAAVGRVHNDYSENSGRKRLKLVLEEDSLVNEVGRYCIVNVWRSISGPVVDTPLAVCDARTVAPNELITTELRYQHRNGEIYLVKYSPHHRWSYFSEMDRHEALIFKSYDSQESGVARFTPHCAFDCPVIPPDAPLRESIELRCLVIFD